MSKNEKKIARTNLIILGMMVFLYVLVVLLSRIYLGVAVLITLSFIVAYILFTYVLYRLFFGRFVYRQKTPKEILWICETRPTRKWIGMYAMFVIVGLSWVLLFTGVASKTDPNVTVYTPPIKILPPEYYDPDHPKNPFILLILVIGWISMLFSFALETYLTVTKIEKILAKEK